MTRNNMEVPTAATEPQCPQCKVRLVYYDGALGYESMVCPTCNLDINDWLIYERAKEHAWDLYMACRAWETAEENGGVSMADLRTFASNCIRGALKKVEAQ